MKRNSAPALPWDLRQKLDDLKNFVVLDVETTGFSCNKDRIIEIGLIKVVDGQEEDAFSSFVNPGIPLPQHITNLTGITDADVQPAPTFEELAPRIVSFLGPDIIVGHNVLFDIGFIKSKFLRCGICQCFERFDTLTLVRKALPELKSHKLCKLIEYFGFNEEQNHRALDDARLTLKILNTIQGWYKVPSLDEAIRHSKQPIVESAFSANRFADPNISER